MRRKTIPWRDILFGRHYRPMPFYNHQQLWLTLLINCSLPPSIYPYLLSLTSWQLYIFHHNLYLTWHCLICCPFTGRIRIPPSCTITTSQMAWKNAIITRSARSDSHQVTSSSRRRLSLHAGPPSSTWNSTYQPGTSRTLPILIPLRRLSWKSFTLQSEAGHYQRYPMGRGLYDGWWSV